MITLFPYFWRGIRRDRDTCVCCGGGSGLTSAVVRVQVLFEHGLFPADAGRLCVADFGGKLFAIYSYWAASIIDVTDIRSAKR